MTLAPGTKLGPYEIHAPLGAGGMGEVYRAHDARLSRDVAVKVLPHDVTKDPDRLRRFQLEACAASALNHPNVLTIYDVGASDGIPYFVSELLEGESLRDRLRRGAIPSALAVDMALQVASGLAVAHEKGIVHRDLKPENLFVTRDGRVKILDFGLAKQETVKASASSTTESVLPTQPITPVTEPGSILGTVGYMSPEQVRGLPSDHRSDVFSLGAVFYEMLTGERAFQRASPVETMSAILRDTPERLSISDASLAPELKAVLAHCLEKDPASRFQSARDLAFALKLPEARTPSSPPAIRAPEGPTASVAVLPFRNMSPDKDAEYFSDGMTEEIINVLMKIDALRVPARTSSFAFKGKDEDVRTIGERLGVQSVLEGSVRQAAGKIRVSVQLIDVASGYQLWSERYDRALADVFEIQDEIARAIAGKLEVSLLGRDQQPLVSHATRHHEAYDLYLQGRFFFNQRVATRAIEKLEAAIALDPEFAPAYTGLSDAYGIFAFYGGIPTLEAFAKARAAAEKARALSPDSADVPLSMGIIEHYFGWDFEREDRELFEASRRSPRSASPWYWLALLHGTRGPFEEASSYAKRAVQLEPHAPNVVAVEGWPLLGLRRFDEAAAAFQRALQIAPNSVFPLFSLGIAHQTAGQHERAITVFERLVSVTERDQTLALGLLGGAYAAGGREGDAKRVRAEIEEKARTRYVAPVHDALVQVALGEREAAIDSLDRSVTERNALAWHWVEYSPLFESLRDDPAFARVRAKIVPA